MLNARIQAWRRGLSSRGLLPRETSTVPLLRVCDRAVFGEQEAEHHPHATAVRYAAAKETSGSLNYQDSGTFHFISKSSDPSSVLTHPVN